MVLGIVLPILIAVAEFVIAFQVIFVIAEFVKMLIKYVEVAPANMSQVQAEINVLMTVAVDVAIQTMEMNHGYEEQSAALQLLINNLVVPLDQKIDVHLLQLLQNIFVRVFTVSPVFHITAMLTVPFAKMAGVSPALGRRRLPHLRLVTIRVN